MDQVAEIREKIDVVQLISEYIPTKKAGRNIKALCPFHNEKSPSFVISPERQIWHCFGCGKGGDAYTFLMEYEHMEFPEALRSLAKKAGVTLVQSSFETASSSQKERMYKLNALAAEYYHYVLTKHPIGKKALAYLANRNVSPKVIESFKIGYAPLSGRSLSSFLIQKKKYDPKELYEIGLSYPKGNMAQDFFWDRIIFPLYDHRDNIVGFSGRMLTEKPSSPKYINTKDTLIYHKGELFFGLNMTKEAIRKENQAILVEGEFDVLSCFQNGIGNVVAIKGTALTEKQVTLLSRFAQKITICFDGDNAGQEAIKRSLPIIEKKGLQTTVILIPGGKDPDESLRADPTALKIAVKHDTNIYDYLLANMLTNFDKETSEGKKAITDTILPIYNSIQNEIIKEHYLKKLSTELDTTYESIQKQLERVQMPKPQALTEKTVPVKKSREENLEEYLLALILQSENPKLALEKAVRILMQSISKERAYQKLFYHLLSYFEGVEVFDSTQFGSSLPTELQPIYDRCILFPIPTVGDAAKVAIEITKTAEQLKEIYVRQKIKLLGDQIKKLEGEGDVEEVSSLKENYSALLSQLQKP